MADAVKITMKNMQGKAAGDLEVRPEVFAAPVNRTLVYEAVRWQRALRRAGTHSVQTRGDMKGGGSKPWKQKGTGRARAGSSNSPVWVGGAKAHGPKPRSYDFRLPKRTRRQALCSVLTDKLQGDNLVVLDKLEVSNGKTKELTEVLKNLGVADKKLVVVTAEKDELVWRAGRNVKRLHTLPVAGANVYDMVNANCLITTKEGILALQDRLLQTKE